MVTVIAKQGRLRAASKTLALPLRPPPRHNTESPLPRSRRCKPLPARGLPPPLPGAQPEVRVDHRGGSGNRLLGANVHDPPQPRRRAAGEGGRPRRSPGLRRGPRAGDDQQVRTCTICFSAGVRDIHSRLCLLFPRRARGKEPERSIDPSPGSRMNLWRREQTAFFSRFLGCPPWPSVSRSFPPFSVRWRLLCSRHRRAHGTRRKLSSCDNVRVCLDVRVGTKSRPSWETSEREHSACVELVQEGDVRLGQESARCLSHPLFCIFVVCFPPLSSPPPLPYFCSAQAAVRRACPFMPASLREWASLGDSGGLPAAPSPPPSPAYGGSPTGFASPSLPRSPPLRSPSRAPFFRLQQRQGRGTGLRFDDREALALRVLWEVSGQGQQSTAALRGTIASHARGPLVRVVAPERTLATGWPSRCKVSPSFSPEYATHQNVFQRIFFFFLSPLACVRFSCDHLSLETEEIEKQHVPIGLLCGG